ncbi:hypothetical protein ACFSCX_06255 [Bacillus salitolerans]|uniref:DUF4288 domain-containing protein n=1 Tax=Bacillus salitolerans TaxID=1437434 RepID=A0ABW4LN25_9BACI
MEKILNFWLVKLGKLYYAGGLKRLPNNENSFSLEFVKDKEVAFLFIDEDIANHISEKCGGEIEKIEITSEEYSRLIDNHERYTNSEIEWEKEQEREILNELRTK